MSKKITIAGLGWLGKPLASTLKLYGYSVKGSVTDAVKAKEITKSGITCYPLVISEDSVSGMVTTFLSDTEVLIIMIPPGLRRNTGANYALKMAVFLNEIENAGIPNVILVSSTSVYADDQGQVSEHIVPMPDTDAGRQLYEVEQLFFNSPSFECTIVRFGGLYGGSRNPVKFLAGRKNLSNGEAPVNLIHRQDCIGILMEILKRDAFGHIFNCVHPMHPSKKEYYTNKAKELGLEPPEYQAESKEVFKQVESNLVRKVLNYHFRDTF
ncbi:nucleoside-diphosphate-sugar epimerase [Dokdonia sp. Hel_I_53]|nr:nucleoside-diphosphate-sugar epimerase [Dokdonia sp. Hel_I_53]